MQKHEVDGKISSVIELISKIDLFPKIEELWFRGQSKYTYKLTPSLFRQGNGFDVSSYDETQMYNEFIRRYPEQSINHRTVFEWLTLMQHYGLPTRLLDWTSNLLVALYFCCKDDQEEDGAVFVFNPLVIISAILPFNYKFHEIQTVSINKTDFFLRLISETEIIFGEETKINGNTIKFLKTGLFSTDSFNSFESKTYVSPDNQNLSYHDELLEHFSIALPYRTPHLNPRIKTQHGLFTIHGGKYFQGKSFIKYMEMENIPHIALNMIKIKIKSSDKASLMKELRLSGIYDATLFPEMEYQVKDIKNKFSSF